MIKYNINRQNWTFSDNKTVKQIEWRFPPKRNGMKKKRAAPAQRVYFLSSRQAWSRRSICSVPYCQIGIERDGTPNDKIGINLIAISLENHPADSKRSSVGNRQEWINASDPIELIERVSEIQVAFVWKRTTRHYQPLWSLPTWKNSYRSVPIYVEIMWCKK